MYQIPSYSIQIHTHNRALDALMYANRLHSWVYITACNPYSRPTSTTENTHNMQRLLQILHEQTDKMLLFCGWGMGYDIAYPPEYSILCLGLSFRMGVQLATEFGQNAFVFAKQQDTVQLICLQDSIGSGLLEEYTHAVYSTMPIVLQDNHRSYTQWRHYNQIQDWQIDTREACLIATHAQGYELIVPLDKFSV